MPSVTLGGGLSLRKLTRVMKCSPTCNEALPRKPGWVAYPNRVRSIGASRPSSVHGSTTVKAAGGDSWLTALKKRAGDTMV